MTLRAVTKERGVGGRGLGGAWGGANGSNGRAGGGPLRHPEAAAGCCGALSPLRRVRAAGRPASRAGQATRENKARVIPREISLESRKTAGCGASRQR